ncbi:MAG: hypothetical protein QQN63_12865 [Nitrosopumilus sp.]
MDIQEVTQIVSIFMRRADLKGEEAPTWTEAHNWVVSIQKGEIVPVAADQLQNLIDRDEALSKLEAEAPDGSAKDITNGDKQPEPQGKPVAVRKTIRKATPIESGNLEQETIEDTPDG